MGSNMLGETTGKHRPVSLPDGEHSGKWEEHRMLVLSELTRLQERDNQTQDKLDAISKTLVGLRIDVARVQVKAGIWGALAGIIPVTLALVLYILKGG